MELESAQLLANLLFIKFNYCINSQYSVPLIIFYFFFLFIYLVNLSVLTSGHFAGNLSLFIVTDHRGRHDGCGKERKPD